MSINVKNLLSSVAFIAFSASSTFASDFSNLEFGTKATAVNGGCVSSISVNSKAEEESSSAVKSDSSDPLTFPNSEEWDKFLKAHSTHNVFAQSSSSSPAELDDERKDWFLSSTHREGGESSSFVKADFINSPIYPGSSNWDMVDLLQRMYNGSKQIPSIPMDIDGFPSSSHRDGGESSSFVKADFINAPMCPGSSNWDMVNALQSPQDDSKQAPSIPRKDLEKNSIDIYNEASASSRPFPDWEMMAEAYEELEKISTDGEDYSQLGGHRDNEESSYWVESNSKSPAERYWDMEKALQGLQEDSKQASSMPREDLKKTV